MLNPFFINPHSQRSYLLHYTKLRVKLLQYPLGKNLTGCYNNQYWLTDKQVIWLFEYGDYQYLDFLLRSKNLYTGTMSVITKQQGLNIIYTTIKGN